MATSGSVDYSRNARQIATMALELCGVTAIGDTPATADATKALEQLNLMVKTWGADPKPKLWQLTEGTTALVASTASYSVTAARKIVEARRRTGTATSAQNDTPIEVYSRADYMEIPNKLATGTPLGIYHDPQRAARTIYVWQVPTSTIASTTTLVYTYVRVIEDLDALTDDFDLPQEWLETLQYGLAARLCTPYGVHIGDPQRAADIKSRAQELYGQLTAFDSEEESAFMIPA